jgi:hypothetical protein
LLESSSRTIGGEITKEQEEFIKEIYSNTFGIDVKEFVLSPVQAFLAARIGREKWLESGSPVGYLKVYEREGVSSAQVTKLLKYLVSNGYTVPTLLLEQVSRLPLEEVGEEVETEEDSKSSEFISLLEEKLPPGYLLESGRIDRFLTEVKFKFQEGAKANSSTKKFNPLEEAQKECLDLAMYSVILYYRLEKVMEVLYGLEGKRS